MKKILVVSPHPDDETLGCGGTLLKYKSKKFTIDWMIITSMDGNNSYSDKNKIDRRNQIKKVKQLYGFNKVFELNLPTAKLDQIPLSSIIEKVTKVINTSKPEIVFTNFYGDVHTDHKITYEAISSCTKNFRAPFIKKIIMYETLSETGYSLDKFNDQFTPNIYVDITKYLNKKLNIMKIYKSEVMKNNNPRSLISIDSLARYRGISINSKYAEAFMLVYEKE